MDLTGKQALVTGAGHRLGRAFAVALAEQGAAVAVHFRSSPEQAAETVELCNAHTPGAAAYQADLTDIEATEALFAHLQSERGELSVLVNSVGLHKKTPVDSFTEADWSALLEVNLSTAARCVRLGTPLLKASKAGLVVNVTDALLAHPFPGYGPYYASKAGLEALTKVWASELGPTVRINVLAPGIILPAETDSAASLKRWKKRIPLGRLGRTEELVHALLYFVQADYVSGQILAVDGGLSAAR